MKPSNKGVTPSTPQRGPAGRGAETKSPGGRSVAPSSSSGSGGRGGGPGSPMKSQGPRPPAPPSRSSQQQQQQQQRAQAPKTKQPSGAAPQYDKHSLAQFVVDLRDAMEQFKAEMEYGKVRESDALRKSPQIAKISKVLECLGVLQLPNRQPSWCKEISAAILMIGLIPYQWLSASDFASISRFVTRASVGKQLAISTDELLGVFNLLFCFLQRSGSGCRDSVVTPSQGSSSGLKSVLVAHEVMRGMAQLLLVRNERLSRHRLEILELLLLYCDPRGVDLESRYAAVDAMGNVLAVKADEDALQPPYVGKSAGLHAAELQTLDRVVVDSRAVVVGSDNGALIYGASNEATKRAVYRRGRAEALVSVHDQCLQSLVDNLKAASNTFLNNSSGDSLVLTSKLLVSCLRALAQCITSVQSHQSSELSKLVTSALPSSPSSSLPQYAQFEIQRHAQSLIQSVYTIFDRILPPVTTLGSADTASTQMLAARGPAVVGRGGAGTMSLALVTETKLWTHAFKLLSVLASFNPSSFMTNWPLFLVDTMPVDMVLQTTVSKFVAYMRDPNSAGEVQMLPVRPRFRSSVFSAATWASQPSIRASAVQCIKAMIRGLPLQRWFKAMRSKAAANSGGTGKALPSSSVASELDSPAKASPPGKLASASKKPQTGTTARGGFLGDKITATVTKIFRFVVLLLAVERDEAVVSELLGTASALIADMPLAVVNGSPRVSALEELAGLLFHLAMVIASENSVAQALATGRVSPVGVVDPKADKSAAAASQPQAAARVNDASVHALQWLSDVW